jgi:hypothetical protein
MGRLKPGHGTKGRSSSKIAPEEDQETCANKVWRNLIALLIGGCVCKNFFISRYATITQNKTVPLVSQVSARSGVQNPLFRKALFEVKHALSNLNNWLGQFGWLGYVGLG